MWQKRVKFIKVLGLKSFQDFVSQKDLVRKKLAYIHIKVEVGEQ